MYNEESIQNVFNAKRVSVEDCLVRRIEHEEISKHIRGMISINMLTKRIDNVRKRKIY